MKVIGIVGMPGSGKGEFSLQASETGIPVVVMGDVIRDEVKKAGLPPVDESMGIVARSLREKYGMAAIAKVCIPVIDRLDSDLVLIDGIRGDAEVKEFASYYPDFTLIAIESSPETRLSRLSVRGRSDDLSDMGELISRDDRESSFGLKKAMELASVRISNEGNLDMFKQCVRDTLRKIGEKRV